LDRRDLHSFPTRRSSDLRRSGGGAALRSLARSLGAIVRGGGHRRGLHGRGGMGGNRAEGPGAPLRAGGDGLKEPDNLNALFARALVDELCAAGAREAVISPGSRSTPLVLACAEEKRMK